MGKILSYTYTLCSHATNSIHASIFAHLFPFIFDKELQVIQAKEKRVNICEA